MAFNIGLSGIRAASTDLEVTGNNVANASTVGFKESRAEFSDIYTTTLLGTGSKPVGSGVLVENVRQEFSQGNISGTENSLDMAIDGNGFFILNDGGSVSYTRAGYYGLDKDGYVVANNGARLQGYEANDSGVTTGVLGDLQIVIGNQPPKLTSRMSSILNLDASENVLQELGQRMVSGGLAIANPDAGIADSTATIHATSGQPTTAGTRTTMTFDTGVDLSAQANVTGLTDPGPFGVTIDPFDGTGAVTLSVAAGVVTAGATPTQHLTNILNALQTELDTQFGNNEFVVTTDQSPLTTPLVANTFLRIERAGYDATVGTSFSVTAPTGNWNALFGDPTTTTTVTAGVAGQTLFTGSNPLTADFRSIPGTSTTNRTIATPPLNMTGFIGGTHPTLDSTIVTSGTVIGDFSGAQSIVFDVEVTDVNGTTTSGTFTIDNANLTGGANTAAVIGAVTVDEIQGEIAEQLAAIPALAAVLTLNAGVPISFTGNTTDPGETITLVPGVSNTYDLTNIGFATTGRTATGDADIAANNEFRMQVTGPTAPDDSNQYNIVIPAKNYASLDDLAAAIQTEIDLRTGANGLAGRVSVAAVGGQLVFTNTEVGVGYNVSFTGSTGLVPPADTDALAALGFDSMSTFLGTDTIDRSNSFRINLTVPAPDLEARSGTTTISLDEEYRSVQQLAASINRQLAALDDDAYIGVRAEAVEIVPNVVPPEYKMQFVAVEEGEASVITITDFIANGADVTSDEMYGLLQIDEDDNSLLTLGIEGVTNEYPEQSVTFTDPDGNETVITTEEDAEANAIAAIFNRQAGITASASSELTIPLTGYNNPGNTMTLKLNGQELVATSLTEIVDEINGYQTTTLPGFSAELNSAGDMIIKNSIGRDIKIEMVSSTVTDSIVITGSPNAGPVVLGGTATADTAAVVGGTIEFILNEGYSLSSPSPSVSGVFGALSEDEFSDYVLNSFDPTDQNTYNHATSTTIYDSLGNTHIMTQYFVKEPIDPTRPNEENIWAMYILIDEQDVGDPDPTLTFPENLEPTRARYELFFNPDGTLDVPNTGELYVTNWDPLDSEGQPTGALKSLNVLEGGLPLTEPANSSNFQIFLDGSTQFGSPFSVNEVSQDGYTTGRLTGLEIDQDGLMFARFTNGQAQVLGQVALATFKNPEGLIPLGDTAWGESFESGVPTVGSPRTGTFGNLRSAALEDSNVDLSEELVGLIIAQRNFQASAKTIETSDTVTQTIIQL